MYLIDGSKNFFPTHIWRQSLRYSHAAVRLEAVFKKGYEHTRRGDDSVIESMGQIHLAICALYAHFQAAGLRVAQIRAGADLEIFLLAW